MGQGQVSGRRRRRRSSFALFSHPSSLFLPIRSLSRRLSITLATPLSATPLADLRAAIAQRTSLAPHSFKIVHSGGICQSETRFLAEYGIREGATLAIIGGVGQDEVGKVERDIRAAQEQQGGKAGASGGAKKADETQTGLIERIRKKVEDTQETFGSQLEEFEAEVRPTPFPTLIHCMSLDHAFPSCFSDLLRQRSLLFHLLSPTTATPEAARIPVRVPPSTPPLPRLARVPAHMGGRSQGAEGGRPRRPEVARPRGCGVDGG